MRLFFIAFLFKNVGTHYTRDTIFHSYAYQKHGCELCTSSHYTWLDTVICQRTNIHVVIKHTVVNIGWDVAGHIHYWRSFV